MLSHLRFHRRAPSNPSSPTPDQIAAWEAAAHHDHPDPAQDNSPRPHLRSRSPNPPQPPATLPTATMALRTDAEPPAATAGKPSENRLARAKPPPPPINTGLAGKPLLLATKQARATSFVAPTELHQATSASASRPSGTRLSSEPASLPSSAPPPETQKTRKGLPFLKNPVSSLLMRRKSSQTPIDVQSVDTTPSYDPRIRGTRVHDFSAPRKRVVPSTDALPSPNVQPPTPSTAAPGAPATDYGAPGPANHAPASAVSLPDGSGGGLHSSSTVSLSSQSVPPVPLKDEAPSSDGTPTSATSKASFKGALKGTDPKASVRSTASRAFSLSGRSIRSSIMSAVPKHMKSTSSRFSFDMAGAAKQERLLEERHRQREQGKKTPDLAPPEHDSRFDDFDEDFDYDAMMDDDGFEEPIPLVNADYEEEPIPGVNADYEEEQDYEAAMDPDNDQENFAGFVFQRSHPASALPSPHTPAVLPTPRDANGKVIGFAMTKDVTPDVPTPVTADAPPLPRAEEAMERQDGHAAEQYQQDAPNDLACQPSHQPAPVEVPAKREKGDDIYFDDGLADELDFQSDGFVFDESIFDNQDTDKYGRPIPGAFAQAQEAMRAAQLQSKRESDLTSPSEVPQSTAHTSLSVGIPQPAPMELEQQEQLAQAQNFETEPMALTSIPGQDLAYQAALAEAAQKAAASGKFRRDPSPAPVAESTVTFATDPANSLPPQSPVDNSLDHYEDEDDYGGFDSNYDYDFDDDAIIAEANASALANDSDGWYGQEFGFYSAPVSTQGGNSNRDPNPSALSAENLFSYANGGYFGPAGGLARTTSGRVVSREPNLTPITERSEYSNRNSIMSLALPPVIGSAEGGRNSLNSPGLAQLALLGLDDSDSTMSLSALMKLRSKAWGGSQASLPTSREGSPRSERAPGMDGKNGIDLFAGHIHAGNLAHARKGSAGAFSMWSDNGDGTGGGGSPVTTPGFFPPSGVAPGGGVLSPLPQRPGMGMGGTFTPPPLLAIPSPLPQNGGMSSGFACSPVLEGEEVEDPLDGYEDEHDDHGHEQEREGEMDGDHTVTVDGLAPALPVTMSGGPVDGFADVGRTTSEERPSMGHKHKGSADSISYTMDDLDGGKRWVVERRRTAESGEVEILGREVVEGGRI
ncbi:hypothetical protein QBC42DRAFT_273041 [Cladorrhinum samala]|uniref:AGC-kinase C-terminal domain-containing protein n=1 Tax=Cladorrhinum samala TaxID=585594 RepID=A0AAV9HHW7_9PEZI|nr:hypothetical protein QBC42DRAFT_273041 [Cladorrhinum samala]